MAEGQGATYTLDQALSAIGIGKYQLYLLAYAGLGSIAEAMEMMLLTFIGLRIQSEMSLTPTQVNLISVVTYVGLLVGSCFWGYISDCYGRKKGIIGASIVAVIAGFISIKTFTYKWLLLVRAIFGLGLGGGHIYYTWFEEFLPTPNQGIWMVAFSGFYTFGTIVQALLVWLIIPNYSWRWLMGAAIAPHFAASCLIWLVPESPRFLCEQGRVVAAHFVLVAGAAINSRKLPEGTLIYDQVTSNVGIDQPVRTRGPLERLEEAHVGHGISSPSINHEDSTDSTLTLPLLNKSYANPNDFDSQETGSVFDGSPRSTRNNLGTLAQTDIVNDDNSANTGQNPLESVTGDFLGHLEESAHNSADISMYSPERTNSSTEIFDDEHDERHNDENDDERVNDANEISTIQDERLNIVNDDERQNDENEIHTIHDERSNDVNDDERQNDENEIHTIHDERFNDVNDDERQNDENEIHSIHDEGFNNVNDDERQNDENEIHIMVPQLPFSSSFGSGSHSITSILSPRWRRTTLLIWVLYFFNTFNYYEFGLLTFQSSPGSLFTAKDFKNSWPLRNVFIISLAEIPGLIIAAIMLNKFERKFSIIILLVAGAFVIFLIMFFQGKVLTLILMFLARMFMWSSFVLVQIYSTEAFPTTLRTTGVLVATALGNTGGTVWPIISSMIHESGYMLPFLLYEAKMLVTGLCVSLIPVGTTQRNLELPVQQNRPGD